MDGGPTAPETIEEAEKQITRVPLVLGRRNFSWLTERISGVVEQPAPRWWWVAFAITSSIATFGLFCIGYQISTGVGTWGNQIPVGWAWDITNFVFWIGIGHAGTLISAILFLLRQKWRTSINRSAEAMTLFAVICAAIFPGIHVGRFWMAWYMAPIPNNWGIWQNFRSALMWDVFAVSTYFTVSVLFWYTGLIPDLATLRDRATTKVRKFLFGIFALRLARRPTAIGAITKWRICFWPAFPRRWSSRCTAWYPSTSPRRLYRRGTRQFSRPTSWRAQFSADSRWC